jgi:hypothetical protein
MDPPPSDVECRLCSLQDVRYPIEVSKHFLFHKPCHECEEATSKSRVTLCNRCQHLRLRHLLSRCWGARRKPFYSISVSFELSLGDPETCALCLTITSSAKAKDGTDMSDMTLVFGNDGKCTLSWAKYNHVYFYVDKSGKNLLRVREYID